jgi:hypothetical protein
LTIVSGVRDRVTEPIAKFSREMRIVAKAAGVGNLAEGPARAERRLAMQKPTAFS